MPKTLPNMPIETNGMEWTATALANADALARGFQAKHVMEDWNCSDEYTWLEGHQILEVFNVLNAQDSYSLLPGEISAMSRLVTNAALLLASKDVEDNLQKIIEEGRDGQRQ